MIWYRAAAIAILALVAAPASAQPAGACAGPPGATGKAVCSVPKLVRAETAMALELRVLRRALPEAQRPALDANQQIWLRARDAACSDKREPLLIDCVFDETEARHRVLAGTGRNGSAGRAPFLSGFFHELRKGEHEIAIVYPQIAAERNSADAIFNKMARDLVLGDQGLMREYRAGDAAHRGTPAIHLVSYDIAYLSPALATIVFRHVSLGGGMPHPFTARQTLVFDFNLGRPLAPEDVLEKPALAVEPIAALCKQRLEKEASAQGWRLSPRADFVQVVNTFRSWAPGAFALEILYDAEMVAPYSAGGHECRLDYAALLRWLKPGGPLPPH